MVKAWKKIKEKIIKTGFRSINIKTFKLPDGKVKEFTIRNEGKTVCVLPITPDGKVILFKQFRPGPEKILLELPGGACGNEKPEEAIKRELLEETGYSGNFKFLGTNFHCAYSSRVRYNFVATNCKKIAEQNLDESEFGEVILLSLKDFKKHLRSGELTDMETGYLGLEYLKF